MIASVKFYTSLYLVPFTCYVSALGLGYFGTFMPCGAHEDLNDMIRNVASFVFAVSGLWIGLFCPRALEILSNKVEKNDKRRQELGNVVQIFHPIFISVGLLFATIVHSVSLPVLCSFDLDDGWKFTLKWYGFTFIVCMIFLLIHALYLTCKPGLFLILTSDKDITAQASSDSRTALRPPNEKHTGTDSN